MRAIVLVLVLLVPTIVVADPIPSEPAPSEQSPAQPTPPVPGTAQPAAPEQCKCAPPIGSQAEREQLARRSENLQLVEQYQKWLARRRLSGSLARWSRYAAEAGTGALAGFAISGATHGGSIRFDAGSFPFDVAMVTLGLTMSLGIAAYAVDPGTFRPVPPVPALGPAPRQVVGYAWRF